MHRKLMSVAFGLVGALLMAGPASAAPPPNDNWSNAKAIGKPALETEDSTQATMEVGEPDPSCEFNSVGVSRSIWYAYTPATSGDVVASTFVSTQTPGQLDTVLAVYTGSTLTTLTEEACNDDATFPAVNSVITHSVSAGTTYYYQVSAWDPSNAGGDVIFNLVQP